MNAIRTIEKMPSRNNLCGITKLLTNQLRFICLFVNNFSLLKEVAEMYEDFGARMAGRISRNPKLRKELIILKFSIIIFILDLLENLKFSKKKKYKYTIIRTYPFAITSLTSGLWFCLRALVFIGDLFIYMLPGFFFIKPDPIFLCLCSFSLRLVNCNFLAPFLFFLKNFA